MKKIIFILPLLVVFLGCEEKNKLSIEEEERIKVEEAILKLEKELFNDGDIKESSFSGYNVANVSRDSILNTYTFSRLPGMVHGYYVIYQYNYELLFDYFYYTYTEKNYIIFHDYKYEKFSGKLCYYINEQFEIMLMEQIAWTPWQQKKE